MEKSADLSSISDQNMTPKNIEDPAEPNAGANAGEADLQEMVEVNESLDQLTRALDFFEQRTDDIIAQLKVLLDSNREIRQQMAVEKDTVASLALTNTNAEGGDGDADENMEEAKD